MTIKTTFHLSKNTFSAVTEREQRDILVAYRADSYVNERIGLCCDDTEQAIQATITAIRHNDNHPNLMGIEITDVDEVDYAYFA